jgi:hypothetical protein
MGRNPPMNSKLRDILNNLVNRTYGLHSVQIKEVPRAEKAIRRAVAEEMLELVGIDISIDKDHACRFNDGEQDCDCYMGGRNQFRYELRQKIKEWSQS